MFPDHPRELCHACSLESQMSANVAGGCRQCWIGFAVGLPWRDTGGVTMSETGTWKNLEQSEHRQFVDF